MRVGKVGFAPAPDHLHLAEQSLEFLVERLA